MGLGENTTESEKLVPREQPQLQVHLGYRNALDRRITTEMPRLERAVCVCGTDEIYQCLYRKNLRLFPCCWNHIDATLQPDIRQANNRQTLSGSAPWGPVLEYLVSGESEGARCSSVVRAFARGAMGRRTDPSTHFIYGYMASDIW